MFGTCELKRKGERVLGFGTESAALREGEMRGLVGEDCGRDSS
jgi:hypothetical protein